MPPWLLILILMEGVILLINPTRKDFAWYQGLRRPSWLTFSASIPLIWLLIHACFYLSALISWSARNSWNLVLAYVVLLIQVEGYTWLMCRSRRLSAGTMICLISWTYGLFLTMLLSTISLSSALLMLPFLFWTPIEGLITWQMRQLNPGY
ncbi:MAG: tryptophan-rich sensory protein [Cyanobium sp.]